MGIFLQKTQTFESGPQSDYFFLKRQLIVFVWKEFEYNDVIHHTAHGHVFFQKLGKKIQIRVDKA